LAYLLFGSKHPEAVFECKLVHFIGPYSRWVLAAASLENKETLHLKHEIRQGSLENSNIQEVLGTWCSMCLFLFITRA